MSRSIYLVAGQSNAALLGSAVPLSETGMGAPVRVPGVHVDGAPLTYANQRLDWFQPGELASQLIATLRSALLADPQARLAGIVWVQGEADTYSVARATEYGARLEQLVDRVAAGLAEFGARAADFGFVVTALSTQAPASQVRPEWQTIREQQLSLDHPRITVIDPDAMVRPFGSGSMFMADGLHYQPGMRQHLLQQATDALPRLVQGTAASDWIEGRCGDDRIGGSGGQDRLFGGAGDDRLWGGPGDDILWGQDDRDTLIGESGQDRLYGGAGADRLAGGAAIDTLFGGAGADVFVFGNDGPTLRSAGGHDVVADFVRGSDRIDLSLMDANSRTGLDEAFRFVGTAAFTRQPGELRHERGDLGLMLIGDRDGDGLGDVFIRVTGPTVIFASDLIL